MVLIPPPSVLPRVHSSTGTPSNLGKHQVAGPDHAVLTLGKGAALVPEVFRKANLGVQTQLQCGHHLCWLCGKCHWQKHTKYQMKCLEHTSKEMPIQTIPKVFEHSPGLHFVLCVCGPKISQWYITSQWSAFSLLTLNKEISKG